MANFRFKVFITIILKVHLKIADKSLEGIILERGSSASLEEARKRLIIEYSTFPY